MNVVPLFKPYDIQQNNTKISAMLMPDFIKVAVLWVVASRSLVEVYRLIVTMMEGAAGTSETSVNV
jgi:hypothetical protein